MLKKIQVPCDRFMSRTLPTSDITKVHWTLEEGCWTVHNPKYINDRTELQDTKQTTSVLLNNEQKNTYGLGTIILVSSLTTIIINGLMILGGYIFFKNKMKKKNKKLKKEKEEKETKEAK